MRGLIAFVVGIAVAAGLLVSGNTYALPIDAISADQVATSFSNSGGTFGHGTLNITSDCETIVASYPTPNPPVNFDGGHVAITTSLFQDCSTGGLAFGIFEGGTFTLKDNTDTTLLSGNITELDVQELGLQPDVLAGTGPFIVTGGTLAADFGGAGSFFDIFFQITPGGIQNFGSNFTGTADVKLTPAPEPATLFLFGTAGLSLIGWMRRKRIK